MIPQVDDGIAVDHLGALRPQHKAEPQQHFRLRQCNAEHLAGLFHLGAALYVLVGKGRREAAICGQLGLYFLWRDARLASFGRPAATGTGSLAGFFSCARPLAPWYAAAGGDMQAQESPPAGETGGYLVYLLGDLSEPKA